MTDHTLNGLIETKRTIILQVEDGAMLVKDASVLLGISRVGFWKLRRNYQRYGLVALTGRKRGPKPYQQAWNRTTDKIEKQVVDLYYQYGVGPDRLLWLLEDRNIELGRATIYRILVRRKVIIPKVKGPRPPVQLYTKGYPGEEVQFDTTEPLGKNQGIMITAVDDFSRYGSAAFYRRNNSLNAAVFLRRLALANPFKIDAIRVDNGSEFKKDFIKETKRLGIRIIRNPPNHPQSNGKVERLHRTIEEECFWRIGPEPSLEEAAYQLSRYFAWYNEKRGHTGYGMNGLTPKEKLEEYLIAKLLYRGCDVNQTVIPYRR